MIQFTEAIIVMTSYILSLERRRHNQQNQRACHVERSETSRISSVLESRDSSAEFILSAAEGPQNDTTTQPLMEDE
jgi:hypothetical protein